MGLGIQRSQRVSKKVFENVMKRARKWWFCEQPFDQERADSICEGDVVLRCLGGGNVGKGGDLGRLRNSRFWVIRRFSLSLFGPASATTSK